MATQEEAREVLRKQLTSAIEELVQQGSQAHEHARAFRKLGDDMHESAEVLRRQLHTLEGK